MTVTEKKTSASSQRTVADATQVEALADSSQTILTPSVRKSLQSKIAETAIGAARAEPAVAGTAQNSHQQLPPNINQPFISDLNKETYPDLIRDPKPIIHLDGSSTHHAAPVKLPPQEGELYRARFTLVESQTNQSQHELSSFTLKGTTTTDINLLIPADPSRVLHLPQIAQRALKLVEQLHNFVPEHASFDTERGELTFTRDRHEFVASPEYVLVRQDDKELRTLLEKQVSDQSKQLSDKLATIFEDSTRTWTVEDGNNRLQSYEDTRISLTLRIASDLKKLGESLEHTPEDLKPGVRQYDLLSIDSKSEVDAWNAGKQKRVQQQFSVLRLSQLVDSLRDTQASLMSLGVFEGHLSDGRPVHGIRNARDNRVQLSLYGTDGSTIACFSPMDRLTRAPHFRAATDWSRLLYQQDGSSVEERFKQSEYPRPYERLCRDSSGQSVVEESLNLEGIVLSRKYSTLGTCEQFKEDGSLDILQIESPTLVLQNFDAVANQPGGHDAIRRMVAARGDDWLSDYKKYQHHADAEQILEAAIAAMPLDQVKRHRLDLETSLNELLTQQPSETQATMAKETQVFLDLFRFRERMLEDGLLIVRQSNATTDTPGLASQVWNDPRARNYFAIENNWIDWRSEQVQRLMGEQDTPLARAELRLLISRALYAGDLQPSQETTQECLRSLEELRGQYSGISILKGRNIVFGAHSGTLSSLVHDDNTAYFIESSADYHEFGKRALIERIQQEQGEGHSFTLVRPERENLVNEAQRSSIMTAHGLSPEQITAVEEQFQCRVASSNAPANTFLLYETLRDSSIDHETTKKIIDEMSGGASSLLDECRRVKTDLLERIANTPPPFTFIFEGHGGPDAIYLSEGQLVDGVAPSESKETTKITVDDLVTALRTREERFGIPNTGEHDIIVFQNCYSSNFVQKLGNSLEGGRIPICIGAAEHNQVSLYLMPLDVGSLFMGEVVTSPEDPDSTIADVLIRQYKDLGESSFRHKDGSKPEVNTNPVIYAPDQSGVLQQIGYTSQKRNRSTA